MASSFLLARLTKLNLALQRRRVARAQSGAPWALMLSLVSARGRAVQILMFLCVSAPLRYFFATTTGSNKPSSWLKIDASFTIPSNVSTSIVWWASEYAVSGCVCTSIINP